MIEVGDTVSKRYKIDKLCSTSGGMGTLFFVEDLHEDWPFDLVMKVCRELDSESVSRFRREVRLLDGFIGNRRVVKIIASTLDHDPPYFVMPYYKQGDLTTLQDRLQSDISFQEEIFGQVIDCIEELHQRNIFHRDIKPQNFLLDGLRVVVSDFGLSTELSSTSAFTKSSKFWGTPGYLPPEFHEAAGFKNADIQSDIFMLGKTFYVLLSGRSPMYLSSDGLAGPIFAVIERCCALSKAGRYQSLASLRQSLFAAYDVLLARVVGPKKAGQILRSINDRLSSSNKFVTAEVTEFIEQLAMLDAADQIALCSEIKHEVFEVFAQSLFKSHVGSFLSSYQRLVEEGNYGWSYAETIAENMCPIVESDSLESADRANALRLAIAAAQRMHRYAAMDTCRKLLRGIDDEELGMRVREILLELHDSFIADTEPAGCESTAIRNTLHEIQGNAKN